MRTAEEILKANFYSRQDPEIDFESLVCMINEARLETIKEAAEVAKAFSIGYDGHPQVDKQSILSLINQIK